MADSAAIDELRVEVVVELDRVNREIASIKRAVREAQSETERSTGGIRRAIESAQAGFGNLRTAVLGAAGVLGVGSAISFGRSLIASADALEENAESLGFAIERFQEVQFAATLTGQSVEQFRAGILRFNNAIGSATRGEEEFAKTFKALGIALTDSNGQSEIHSGSVR